MRRSGEGDRKALSSRRSAKPLPPEETCLKVSKTLAAMISTLLTLLLLLSLLSAIVLAIGLDPHRMADMFRRHGNAMFIQTDTRRLDIARELVDYLRFARDDLPTFQAHEQLHMADVRGIFGLLYVLAPLGNPAALGLWLMRRRGSMKCCAVTCGGFLAFAAGLGVWGAVDFDNLFVLFHRIAFTNDLWLLDPRTDLMIQLMPTSFFIEYAAVIAGFFLAVAVVLLLFSLFTNRRYV